MIQRKPVHAALSGIKKKIEGRSRKAPGDGFFLENIYGSVSCKSC